MNSWAWEERRDTDVFTRRHWAEPGDQLGIRDEGPGVSMLGWGPGYVGAENPPGDVFSFEQGVAWLSLKETSLEQYTSR